MNKFYSAAKYGLVALHQARIGVAGLAVTLPLFDALDDPALERAARAQACLNVGLHRALADRYQGQPLAATAELERVMAEELGVSTGQVANARLVALRSLHQAGLIGADGCLASSPSPSTHRTTITRWYSPSRSIQKRRHRHTKTPSPATLR